jgi:hypothetical protein
MGHANLLGRRRPISLPRTISPRRRTSKTRGANGDTVTLTVVAAAGWSETPGANLVDLHAIVHAP